MYRTLNLKLIKILTFISLMILGYSCVPKSTESKALCGTNQAFNSVTRKCYSVAETRYVPVPTLSTLSVIQETVLDDVVLSYTDGNKDSATSCSITGVNANIQMVSPVLKLTSGVSPMETKITDLYDAINNLKDSLCNYSASSGTPCSTEAGYLTSISSYKSSMGDTVYLSKVVSNAASALSVANNAIANAAAYTSNSSVSYFYNLSQTKYNDALTAYNSIANNCLCTGGVCKTVLIPARGFSGSAGFSYTITDVDGVSSSKSVTATISANDRTASIYLPIAQSVYVTGSESYSSIAGTYTFSLGAARDYFSTSTFTYRPTGTFHSSGLYIDSDSGLGKITGCVNSNGTLNPSATCIYTPNSGDTYSSTSVAKATNTLGSLTYTAKANGTNGNNIKIYYKNITDDLTTIDPYATEMQKYGLVNSSEIYLRVIGNSIYVFINKNYLPTTLAVQNLILNDSKAKTLVDVSGGSASSYILSTEVDTNITLIGGLSGFDNFSYTVTNAYGTSVAAKAAIDITSVVDIPFLTSVGSNSTTIFENSSSRATPTTTLNIDLSVLYTATDGVINGATGCFVTDATVGNYLSSSPPSCTCNSGTGVCTATVYPVANASGSAVFPFQYKICSSSGCSSWGTYNITITSVNDQPTASGIVNHTMAENSSTASSYSFDITTTPGGAGFETSQTTTVTAASSDTSVVPNANIVITNDSTNALIKHVTITPTANTSSASGVTITYTVTDTGGTTNCDATFAVGEACNKKLYSHVLTITPVNDPPVITYTGSDTFPVYMNEGGYVVVGPFKVDEDAANTSDENADPISLNITSDNQAVIADANITAFYDLNDNGVEDSGESRAMNAMLETSSGLDSSLHQFYVKLTPVGGSSGSANITITATDGTSIGPAQSSTKTFSFVVNPVAAIHGGWSNISAVGMKTDKFGAPANPSDINCNYTKSTEATSCTFSSGTADCTNTYAPSGIVTTTKSNVLYWDSKNKSCYYSYANPISTATPAYLWKQLNTTCPVTNISVLCDYTNSATGITTVTTGPSGSIIPSTVGAYYYNSTNGQYYVSTGTATNTDWSTANVCNSSKAIKTSALTYVPLPNATNQYYYDTTTNKCIKSQLIGSTYSWNTTQPYSPSKVTLSWNAFTLTGSGTDLLNSIKGYNVYRREARKDYDFKNGQLINTTYGTSSISLTSSTLTFVDNTAEGGKTYYYTVRPVDTNHGLATYTPEIFSEVRVIAPPKNYSFVHRWMINQEICTKMHATVANGLMDPSKSYRCPYTGPGAKASCAYTVKTTSGHCQNGSSYSCTGSGTPSAVGVTNMVNGDVYYDDLNNSCYTYNGTVWNINTSPTYYYDYGKDLLVDSYEIGCPYTLNTSGGHCANGTNGCVGIGDPTVASISGQIDGDIYYDRSAGKCWMYKGASSTWYEMDDTTNVISSLFNVPITSAATYDPYNTALNAPMVNIKASSASTMCGYRSAPTVYNYSTTAMSLGTMQLPEKKDFIAYSAAPTTLTDSAIADLELGDSLNVQSRCNGSSASGLAAYYTDSDLPTSSTLYSLPGTNASAIRSLYTGSIPWGLNYGTESCVSRYGIQDLYGNVAEWTKDKMSCANSSSKVCTSVSGTSLYYDFGNNSSVPKYYGFDMLTGPFNDTNGSGIPGDTATASDSFLTSWAYQEENFEATKFSIPLALPIYSNYTSYAYCPATFQSSGTPDTTTTKFSSNPDTKYYLDRSAGKCYSCSGGTFHSGTSSYYTCDTWTDQTSNSTLIANVSNIISYILDIGSTNGITYAQLHGDGMITNSAAVNDSTTNPTQQGAFAVGGSYLSGSKSGRYTSELIPTATVRSDVGFRCMVPVPSTQYDTTDTFHKYNYNY